MRPQSASAVEARGGLSPFSLSYPAGQETRALAGACCPALSLLVAALRESQDLTIGFVFAREAAVLESSGRLACKSKAIHVSMASAEPFVWQGIMCRTGSPHMSPVG